MHLGRYEVIRKIGAGGFGEVLLARALGAEGFERIVAVKRLKGELARREGSLQGIINEARIGGLLNHPNVVQVLEFIQVGTDYLLVMEYVDGIGLQELLDLERTNVQLLEPRHAFDIIIQACEGLNYAHSARSVTGQPLKLIHRDIKPSNLMITRTGTVKVMDFGVARSVTNKGQSSTGSIKGTLRYLSPEQAEGSKEIGHESDLFSLGLVLCEMLIKRPVYEADQEHLVLLKALQGRTQDAIAEAEQKVPGTGSILRKCLANQPDERYRTADELAQALRNLKSRYAQGEGLARLVDDALAVRKQDNFDDEVSTDTTFSLELRRKELGLPRPGWEMLKSEAPTEQLSRAAVKSAIKQALAEEPRNIEDLMESAPWEWEWRVAESDTSNPWMGDAFDRAAPPSGLGIPLTPPSGETKTPQLEAAGTTTPPAIAERTREKAPSNSASTEDLITTTQIKAHGGVNGSRSEVHQTSPKVVSLWGAVLPAMSPAVAEPGARGAQRGEGAAAASAASPTLVAGLRPQAVTVPIEERRTFVGNPLSARAEYSPGAGIRETPAAFPPAIPLYTPENSPLNVNGSGASTNLHPPAAPEQVLEADAPTPIRPSGAARNRTLPRVDEHARTQEMLPITQRVARRLDPPAFAAAAEAAPVLTRTAPMPKMQVASAAVAEVPEEIEEMEAEESGIFDLEDLLADPLSVPPSQRTLSLKAGVVKLNGAPQNVEAIRKNAAILAGSGQADAASLTPVSDPRVPSSAPVPPPPSASEAEAVEEAPLEAGSEEDEDEEWSVVASGASEEAEEAVAAAPTGVPAPASTSKMAPVGGAVPVMPEPAPKTAVSAAASRPATPAPAPVVAAPPELSVPPAFADEAHADRAETPTVERVIPYGGIRRANLQKIKGSPMPFVSETGEFRVLRRPAEQENLAEQTLSGQTLSGQTLSGQTPADRTLKTSANESAGELSDKGQSEKSQLELGLTDAGIKPSLPEWDSKTQTTQAGRASAGKTEPRAGLAAVAGAESDDMLAENSTVSRFFVPMEPQTRTVVLNSDGLNAAEEGDGTRVLTPNRPARSSQGPLLSVLEAPHPEQTGLSPRQFVLGFMLGVGLLAAGFLLGVVWERSHTGGRLPDPQVSVPRP